MTTIHHQSKPGKIALDYYHEQRKNLDFPAKWAWQYAKDWQLIQELEEQFDIDLHCEEEIDDVEGSFGIQEDADDVINALHNGNPWAWFMAKVTVKAYGFEASDCLGGCSYKDEQDFKQGGYYLDMILECLGQIESEIYNNQEGEH